MGTTPGSKTMRTIEKILFVNGLQPLTHGVLDQLVLTCRNAYWPRLTLSFGEVHPANRLMAVPLFLQPRMQVLKIRLQVPSILRLGDAIHPDRRIGSLTAIGALQSGHVDEVRQRVEPSFGFPLRSLNYLENSW